MTESKTSSKIKNFDLKGKEWTAIIMKKKQKLFIYYNIDK